MIRRCACFLLLVACADVQTTDTTAQAAMEEAGAGRWLPGTGNPPSDDWLAIQLAAAIDFRIRAENSRIHDAKDPGEQLLHASAPQGVIDDGLLGPEALFIIGDDLFEMEFRPEAGLGNALVDFPAAGNGERPNLRRVHSGEFGGPDALGCSGCHSKGGLNGAGTHTQNAFFRGDGAHTLTADERSAPHVLGLGPITALAAEMSRDLAAQRDDAVATARRTGQSAKASLRTKGISFGWLRAHPDGAVDTAGVEGVDADLVVKPLGWKGHVATLPEFAEESLRVHMGVLSTGFQEAIYKGQVDMSTVGSGEWYDPDRDNVHIELSSGQIVALGAYLAQLEIPVIRPPSHPALLDYFARGRLLMDDVGCTSCHVAQLHLRDPVLQLQPPRRTAAEGPPFIVNVALDGETPKLEPTGPQEEFGHEVAAFTDLKRHDMGPGLSTPTEQRGIPRTVFLTRPLWGLADTAPYLHDGRALTVEEAILLHDGEGADSRDRYAALSPDDRRALQVFLLSLTRAPRVFVP